MSRSGRGIPASAACALAVFAGLAGLASSAWAVPNPSSNIRVRGLSAACARAPDGAACETSSIKALDAARAKLGLGPYLLPGDFVRLAPARQWLILADLDRGAYALRPITGLSASLNAVARRGADARADPDPWPLLMSLRGQSQLGFASNWAGGQANPLLAYYGWMYDDGYGSGNVDCRSPSAHGCWGHRQTIFAFPHAASLSMGAAATRGAASYALTVVETSRAAWPYSYTWTAAMADGAGVKRP